MIIRVTSDSRHIPEFTAKSSDGSEGYGNSPDEAIGHCVRESFLAGSPVAVDDIVNECE